MWRGAYVLHEMGGAGSNYNGWQFQHDQPSIQGLLETVLSRKLQQPIRVVGLLPTPPMLVREPAQERKQKLKWAVSHATQDVHDGQERRAPTLASTHAARSRAFAARFRVGALGWHFLFGPAP